jgi:hypothetical protein
MKREQVAVLALAALNVVAMLLFPPHDYVALGRGGAQSFDAFQLVFGSQPNRLINYDLLLLELYWVMINTALAWLMLRRQSPAPISRRSAVVIVAVVNLALMLLFPPFENYASTLRASGTYFDGFYFVFGDKWQRHFYVPLLFMEIVWLLLNAAILWLAFREPPSQTEEADAQLA